MNNKAKARLLRLAPRVTETVETLAELGRLRDLELSAATRHTKKGDYDFAKHAEWSAAGLARLQASLMALDIEAATAAISAIHDSRPTDDLPAWDEPDSPDLTSVCGQGNCNHLEHL